MKKRKWEDEKEEKQGVHLPRRHRAGSWPPWSRRPSSESSSLVASDSPAGCPAQTNTLTLVRILSLQPFHPPQLLWASCLLQLLVLPVHQGLPVVVELHVVGLDVL